MPETELPPHPESPVEREVRAFDYVPPEPPTEPHEDGRSRLWRAFSRPTRGQVVVAVLVALVGFAGVTQVRTNQGDDTYAGLREQDLIDILNGLAGTTQRSESEIQRLEATRDELQSDTSARKAALEQARQQAQVLSILAGTVPVRGPGVTITINEVSGHVRVAPFIDMVQALRTAGAEAMQINHEVRVIAQTSFEDGTGGLLVDGRLLEPPFTVDVIGNPDALVAALRFPDGPQDEFAQDDGAELTFKEVTSVDVETTRDAAEADEAQAQQ
ncbi:MAG TPA: DUF881 domain-containing protein [Nocardioides sp.]|uniref:DUF881 domain-containing protein n=1 Tax=Nocardioides sp. TaxID=35761 RepID=UPI002E3210A0|nr:DUF881 domain-containing protein [Nocardioides sp.]HEX5089473.1 DUF881 domain-containing protein [Nocardioides sp.]